MKLLYRPVALASGAVAARLSSRIVDRIWSAVDDHRPPSPTTDRASWSRVLAAAAIQGVTFSVTNAAVERATARGFQHLFGVWPGEPEAEGAQKELEPRRPGG
jgi:pectin methylesterase-like acyl-CoA thioesterase